MGYGNIIEQPFNVINHNTAVLTKWVQMNNGKTKMI